MLEKAALMKEQNFGCQLFSVTTCKYKTELNEKISSNSYLLRPGDLRQNFESSLISGIPWHHALNPKEQELKEYVHNFDTYEKLGQFVKMEVCEG